METISSMDPFVNGSELTPTTLVLMWSSSALPRYHPTLSTHPLLLEDHVSSTTTTATSAPLKPHLWGTVPWIPKSWMCESAAKLNKAVKMERERDRGRGSPENKQNQLISHQWRNAAETKLDPSHVCLHILMLEWLANWGFAVPG